MQRGDYQREVRFTFNTVVSVNAQHVVDCGPVSDLKIRMASMIYPE